MILNKIQKLSSDLFPEIIKIRRHLHKNPELSFQEFKTSGYIKTKLSEIGIPFKDGIAGTGIVATIKGKSKGKILAVRADMDALPITEKNEVEYSSVNPGVMHACGHDVHTSSLLGAATILNELKDQWRGEIKLIFQPGEEKLPGGASLMIKEGVLENPAPEAVIGQHVMPQLYTGQFGFRAGKYMASTDEIYLTITGKGGHGAMPHLCIDPVLIAAHVITALQTLVSRESNPVTPSVLSFGKVIASGATNIIPDSIYLEGTFRTFDEEWRKTAHERINEITTQICASMRAKAHIKIEKGYPVLYNNEELAKKCKAFAEEYAGKDNVVDLDLWMAAEDFAFYSQKKPSCFYRLGIRNESKGITSSVHTATFDIDENALPLSIGMMAWLAIKTLS